MIFVQTIIHEYRRKESDTAHVECQLVFVAVITSMSKVTQHLDVGLLRNCHFILDHKR